jgi:hypothetical protein
VPSPLSTLPCGTRPDISQIWVMMTDEKKDVILLVALCGVGVILVLFLLILAVGPLLMR